MSNRQVDLSVVNWLGMGRGRIEKGWCQFRTINSKGEYCALGGVLETGRWRERGTGNALEEKSIDYLVKALKVLAPDFKGAWEGEKHRIADWNNAEGRRVEEVLTLYDKALELARVDAGLVVLELA